MRFLPNYNWYLTEHVCFLIKHCGRCIKWKNSTIRIMLDFWAYTNISSTERKTAHLHMTRRRSLFTLSKNDTTNVIHDFGRLMNGNLSVNTSQLFMWRFCVYESVKIVKTNCSCAVFQKTGTLIFQRTKQLSCLSYRSHLELSFELKKGKTNTTRVVRFFLWGLQLCTFVSTV